MESRAAPGPSLLERTAELRAIDDAVERLRQGRGSVVLIQGPAGIGKTAVLRAAVERGRAAGLAVHTAAGSPLESNFSFGAVIDLLSDAVFEHRANGDDSFLGASRLALPLFDEGDAGSTAPLPLLHGLHWLCVSLGETLPRVLVVDDLQWLDQSSLRFLCYLAARIVESPILLILGRRTGEGDDDRVVADLMRGECELLQPGLLSEAAVAQVLREAERTVAPPPGLSTTERARAAASIHERTGGNPLFVGELVRMLVQEPTTFPALATPDSVVELVRQRISGLPQTAHGVGLAAAVLGDRARAGEIAEVTGLSEAEVARAIDILRDAELVGGGEDARFTHPLVRDAVLATVTRAELLDHSRRAARATWSAHPGRSATHLVESRELGPVGEPWVVPTLIRAAAAARARGGLVEAAGYLAHALGEPMDPVQEQAVRLELGVVLDLQQDPTAIEELRRAHELAVDPDVRAVTALHRSDALFHLALLQESAEVARSAQAELGDDEASRAIHFALEATALNSEALVGVNRGRPAQLEALVAEAATPGERAVLVHVAADLAAAGRREHGAVAEIARRALGGGALVREVGPASPLFVYAGTALAWAGDYPAATAHADSGVAQALEQGSLVGLAYATSLRAGICVYRGDIRQADTDSRRVLEELAEADPMCFAVTLGWALEVAIEEERTEEALELLENTGMTGDLPDYGTIDQLLLARGRLRREVGHTTEALVDLEEVGRRGARSHYLNPAAVPWRSLAAPIHVAAGRVDLARDLVETELGLARAFGAPRPVGVALRARAALQPSPARATDDLREAIEVLAHSGARLEHAAALVQLGALPAAGGIEERRELLRAGMDLAHRCGSPRVVSRALTELRATGARPRRPRIQGIPALTPQERRVATLAAQQLSNREIAEALFLTRRTVELHLTNTYRKLGIRTREELVGLEL